MFFQIEKLKYVLLKSIEPFSQLFNKINNAVLKNVTLLARWFDHFVQLHGFGQFFQFFAHFRPKCFCSKSAKRKILLCKVGMGIKLYETKNFDLCCEKIELMK